MDWIGKEFLGSGWRFPVQVDAKTGKIALVSGEEDIKEAVGILLKTYVGERVMRGDFGCRILDFVFEGANAPSFAPQEIIDALTIHEPRIRDVEVKFTEDTGREGVVLADISYVVRSTNNYFNLVYPFYLMEGVAQ